MSFYSHQQQNATNMKYKGKLKKLKKFAENLVFENAALCDQVAQIQDNILYVKEERRFLMKKLLEHDNRFLEEVNNGAVNHVGSNASGTVPVVKKQYKKRNTSESKSKKSSTTQQLHQSQQDQHLSLQMNASGIHNSIQTKQLIQTISVDKNGEPIYPLQIGALTIHNLGKIVYDRPGYHTENWIYPIGFVSTRIYGHIKEPERKCIYTCKIIDDGDYPRFEITPDSDLDYVIAGPSPDLCHAALIQTINNSTDIRNIEIHPQGEVFFGLAHPTVMTLLQTSPDIAKCQNFKSFTFNSFAIDNETDPTINFEALQKHIARSTYHTVLEVKEEPPDELFDQRTSDSGSLLVYK